MYIPYITIYPVNLAIPSTPICFKHSLYKPVHLSHPPPPAVYISRDLIYTQSETKYTCPCHNFLFTSLPSSSLTHP